MPFIAFVEPRSPAAKAGISAGDELLEINGHAITDVLDYTFHSYDAMLALKLSRGCKTLTVSVKKGEGEPLGLTFETYLMDEPRSCQNKCVFCFIDQMPKGMRGTLYFKDDDARLSFLQGNYVTLTNLNDADIERIIRLRVSPINVSVHTTNPELRARILNNRFAGEKLRYLKMLSDSQIVLNAQIVLCPGWNDGAELEKTLCDLLELGVYSVSVVPVGLTKHREGLEKLRPVDKTDAFTALAATDKWGSAALERYGRRVFYCSDEIFLVAGEPIPDTDYYEDFPQLENGVGMTSLFNESFQAQVSELHGNEIAAPFSLATGMLFAPILRQNLDLLHEKCNNVKGYVHAIENRFFGENVTVAGLITGGDLIEQLEGKELGERLMIPRSMLRAGEDVFLDDVTMCEVSERLSVPVFAVSDDELLDRILNI